MKDVQRVKQGALGMRKMEPSDEGDGAKPAARATGEEREERERGGQLPRRVIVNALLCLLLRRREAVAD